MFKQIVVLSLFITSISFAQKSEIQKNKIAGNPTFIEESMQKAQTRMNQITGYELEYYTKSTYNKDGNPIKREYLNEDGTRSFSENFVYNDAGKLTLREMKNEDESLIFTFDYEYTENDYVVIKSENDVNIQRNEYKLDEDGNIIFEKEINLLEENIFIEKKYTFKNGLLVKTEVKYDKENYTLEYQNDQNGNPKEELYIGKDKKMISKFIRKFDSNQNMIEEVTLDQNGKTKNISTIKYLYDDQQNWIKRTQFVKDIDQPISNTTRTIRY